MCIFWLNLSPEKQFFILALWESPCPPFSVIRLLCSLSRKISDFFFFLINWNVLSPGLDKLLYLLALGEKISAGCPVHRHCAHVQYWFGACAVWGWQVDLATVRWALFITLTKVWENRKVVQHAHDLNTYECMDNAEYRNHPCSFYSNVILFI